MSVTNLLTEWLLWKCYDLQPDKSFYTPLTYNQVTSLQQTVHNNSNAVIQLLLLHTQQKPKAYIIQYNSTSPIYFPIKTEESIKTNKRP